MCGEVCVFMSRRKEISYNLRKAIVVAHQSGKGYEAIQIQHSTLKELYINGELSRQLPIFPGVCVPANSIQGQII